MRPIIVALGLGLLLSLLIALAVPLATSDRLQAMGRFLHMRRRSRIERLVATFADATAEGRFQRAESCVRALFEERPGDLLEASGGEDLDTRHGVLVWDAHVVLRAPTEEIETFVQYPHTLKWFQTNKTSHDADSHHAAAFVSPPELFVAFDAWDPEKRQLRFQCSWNNVRLTAYLTLRTVLAREHSVGPILGTEVWVHLEVPDDQQARRLLETVGGAVESGLDGMKSKFGAAR